MQVDIGKVIDMQSCEANNESDMDCRSDGVKGMNMMGTGKMIVIDEDRQGGSDDEISPGKNLLEKDLPEGYLNDNFQATAKKPQAETSMGSHPRALESFGLGGGDAGKGLDIGALAGKLQEVNDDAEEDAKAKADFEEKRRKHYASEFAMAKAMKGKAMEMEDDDEEEKE